MKACTGPVFIFLREKWRPLSVHFLSGWFMLILFLAFPIRLAKHNDFGRPVFWAAREELF
ncbi:hypothetical protein TGS27_1218 [Geobacillus stearothermophilus]|uniref:Uncharacterized protein n=1 Tax=Geobacillus stearothermophilus TaxID=1422 RepID=A0A150M9B4_GEOSE|nr:hypothetical protein GS8_1507 [Geobacillus stearothermophilus]KYD21127.1 hypothetical protein B4109_0091 [Geobacillus stearothermophilus]KYD31701.1 hypothetical protein B4114_0013 [Geobacillus stearothermophilus]OAO83083.1 hypothetical protein TGS27_1218 [Geobacillus stearothermophilus]